MAFGYYESGELLEEMKKIRHEMLDMNNRLNRIANILERIAKNTIHIYHV